MSNRRLNILTACVFILFLAANVVTATVTFTDETDDVFYYENGIVDRANDPHTLSEVPEVDIHSVSFESSTGGTTVFLTVGGEYIEDYVDGYDYTIRIYQGDSTDFDYYHLWTDNANNGWHSWFNSNEHETYSFDEDTLSIFFSGMYLDASTVYFEASATHYHSDGGMDADWYPDGVEKSGLDTDDPSDNSDDGTVDDSNVDDGGSSTTDNSNDDGSSPNTPGFEIVLLIAALGIIFVVLRRNQ